MEGCRPCGLTIRIIEPEPRLRLGFFEVILVLILIMERARSGRMFWVVGGGYGYVMMVTYVKLEKNV